MKTYNLFRTITKCSDHCVNCFENSDLCLEKCVKSIEKNFKSQLFSVLDLSVIETIAPFTHTVFTGKLL